MACVSVWLQVTPLNSLPLKAVDYLGRRLASEGIVTLGVTLSRCVCVRRFAAYITYRLHAELFLAAKIMRCVQCSLV